MGFGGIISVCMMRIVRIKRVGIKAHERLTLFASRDFTDLGESKLIFVGMEVYGMHRGVTGILS